MLAFDTETDLIREAKLAPELACISFSDGDRADLVHWTEGYKTARWLLEQEVTTANGPYDLAVLWAAFPDLRDLVWEAVAAGRVHDVQTRQKLVDIGLGCYRRVFRRLSGEDKPRPLYYNLSDLHARYYGVPMEKDEWRLRYGELRHLPLDQWPEGARKYAVYDAVATSRIHTLQDQAALENPKHNLWDEAAQVRAHFALHLMSCWGFRTDLKQVEKVIGQIDDEMPAQAKRLAAVDLVRKKGSKEHVRNEKLAKAMMYEAVGDAGELTETGYKKVKAGEMNKDQALRAGYVKIDEEWCENSGNASLIDYYHFRQNQLLRAKLTHIRTAATYGLPIQTSFEVLMETGRTSSSESKIIQNSMAVQNLPRKPGLRECFVPREGCTLIACDYGQAELVALAQVTYSAFGYSNMREVLNAGMDLHLDFGASMMGISYAEAVANKKREDVKEYRQLAKCFHGDTEVLTKTGWVRLRDLQQGVEIAAACFSDGGNTHIKWEKPTRLTTRVSDELVRLYNENIDLFVTTDHRMASWFLKEKNPMSQIRDPKTGRMVGQGGKQKKQHLVHTICAPEELSDSRAWPSAGLCEEGAVEVPEQLLRLAVAVQADGNYHGKNSAQGGGEKIRLGFTKQRKIERMRWLLQGLTYREEAVGAAKVPTFYLSPEASAPIRALLDSDKTLPWSWLNLTRRCREIVMDEVKHWDAHIYKNGRGLFSYSTTLEKNADVLQAIASITNRKTSKNLDPRSRVGQADSHRLNVKDRANTRGGNVETIRVAWGKEVYCVTVPSDALLVRYGGKTVVTHQCADFGYPGGLGWASFQSYAKKNWGVTISGEQAKKLKVDWLKHFPEMRDYFKWISDLIEAGGGFADIQQYASKRWRGRCRYTQFSNGLFQALTADAAKHAMFEVSRRCYTVRSSMLYGCRPLGFYHDEILTEARREQAAEAAVEKERLMIEIYQQYTPDVRVTADAHLMDRWSKDAEAAHDERGRLVPWQPPQDEDERAEVELVAV